MLVRAHSDLEGEVEDCQEETVGFQDLEQESLDTYLEAWQDQVTTSIMRAEGIVLSLQQLEDLVEDAGEEGHQDHQGEDLVEERGEEGLHGEGRLLQTEDQPLLSPTLFIFVI